jgi:hypothetical protein
MTLSHHRLSPEDDDPRSPMAARRELCRQLAALRERVVQCGEEDPRAVRSELATLLFFARTLQADAAAWRAELDQRLQEIERQRTAEREERARLAAEREELVRCRDVLQLTIVRRAEQMALDNRGECRRTLPVFALGEGLNVCSASVSWPRKGFRFAKLWLVTLNDARDGVVIKRA